MTDIPPDTRLFELAEPGPLRDKLVSAVLSGAKTSTSSLPNDYNDTDDPVPSAGELGALIDSHLRVVAIVETTEVRLIPIGDVDLDFARDEGEGFESVASWREAHERYWLARNPGLRIDESTVIVTERFRLRERAAQESLRSS